MFCYTIFLCIVGNKTTATATATATTTTLEFYLANSSSIENWAVQVGLANMWQDRSNLITSGSVNILQISTFVTTIWKVPTVKSYLCECTTYIRHFVFGNNFSVHFL